MAESEAMIRTRKYRDVLLKETDWWALPDTTEMTQDQKDYRQALRDLTSSAKPILNDNDELEGVTWPVKPSQNKDKNYYK